MARGTRKGLHCEGTLGGNNCIVQGLRRTRSQTLRKNQEIEIQDTHVCKKENGHLTYVKDVRNTPSPPRDGSPDSAISSNSAKWSVSTNNSIMSRLSLCDTSDTVSNLGSIVEGTNRESKESLNQNSGLWVNDINTKRTPAATPLIRTNAAANGNLVRNTGSLLSISSSLKKEKTACINSRYTSEIVVYLYIFAICASSASKTELEKGEPGSSVIQFVPLNPVALQVVAWFVIGSLYDLMSPRAAVLLPEVGVLLIHLIKYSNIGKSFVDFPLYLSSIKTGLLGSHLLGLHLNNTYRLVGVLSRLNLCYGLCGTLCPVAARVVSHYLGHSINYQLITLLSLLSILSASRVLENKIPKVATEMLPIMSSHLCWINLFGCLVMKVAVTVQAASLLPLLESLLKQNSENVSLSEVVTSGLLCIPAVILPFLLLCTTIRTAISAMASLLGLFYLFMIVIGVPDSFTLVVLIPICGLIAITQNLVLANLLTTSLNHPGVLLASNMALHTGSRYLTPLLIARLMPLCIDNSDISSFVWWQWLSKSVKDKFKLQIFPEVLYSMPCQNVYLHILLVIGFGCSLLLLLFARYVGI